MGLNTQFFKNMPPVTKNLILINVFVFIVCALAPHQKQILIDNYLALHYVSSPWFNPAQLFTYMFLHGGFEHLFFNMFALFIFGPQIEYSFGSKRFLFYYLSCGIGAALVQMGVYAIILHHLAAGLTDTQLNMIIVQGLNVAPQATDIYILVNSPMVGASGAIYGVLLAFGMLYPNAQLMLLIPPIPIKAKWLVIGYAVLELVLGITGRADQIAHFCHLGGMLVGLLIILYWKKKGMSNGGY